MMNQVKTSYDSVILTEDTVSYGVCRSMGKNVTSYDSVVLAKDTGGVILDLLTDGDQRQAEKKKGKKTELTNN